NDAIRITKNGRGTFSDIIKKFDLLEKIGYPLDGFSITVTKENFELINTDILDLAIKRKMTSIAFDYDLINLMHVPVEQRVSKLIKFKEYANKYGIDFFGTWDSPFRNLTSENFLSTNYAFCAAVQGKSLEFNIEGSIKICGHTTTTVGHINNFNKIFDKGGDLIQIVKNRFPGTNEYCSGCKIEGLCGGQCHVTREVVSRSVVRSQEDFFADMCNFYRRVTEALAIKYLLSNKTTMVGNRQSCAL
ncbi:SPASM domain-containing protein, partial [Patescibacteria group bacterium]|nr:SPASM domain-containing protein [Patescibacteria group bacterium]